MSTNIDLNNLKQIANIKLFFENCGFLESPYFHWYIGRVDDRLYETNYPYIVSRTDVVEELMKIEFKNNMHAAFLKTIYNLCEKINLGMNQIEMKGEYNYCWTSSALSFLY